MPRLGRRGRILHIGARPRRQAGRAVVVRGRRPAAPELRGEGGPRRDARPARDRAAARAAGARDAARPLSRRSGQALHDRGAARAAHVHGRRGRGGDRGDRGRHRAGHARAPGRGRAGRSGGERGQDRGRARVQAPPARRRRRDAHTPLRDPRTAHPPLCAAAGRARAPRLQRDVREGDRRRPRRALPVAQANGRRPVPRRGRRRDARPSAARRARPPAGAEARRRGGAARAQRPASSRETAKAPSRSGRATASSSASESPTEGRSGRRRSSHEAPPWARLPQLLARAVHLAPRRPDQLHRPPACRGARARRRPRADGLPRRRGADPAPAPVPAGRCVARPSGPAPADPDHVRPGARGRPRDRADRLRLRRPHARPALRGRLRGRAASRSSSTSRTRPSSSR